MAATCQCGNQSDRKCRRCGRLVCVSRGSASPQVVCSWCSEASWSPFTRWHAEHKQVVSSRQGPGTLRVSGTIKLLSAKPHTVAAPEVHELLARHLARETANLVVPEAKQEMNTFTGAQLAPGK